MSATTKTIVSQTPKGYAAFPTVACHGDDLYVFYRKGVSTGKGHGGAGRVHQLRFEADTFSKAFDQTGSSLEHLADHQQLFDSEQNEMDAIISQLGPEEYTLATRTFAADGNMTTYLSVAETPHFKDRQEIHVPGLRWLVFYGKGFRVGDRAYFSAYGSLGCEPISRPVVIATADYKTWELVAHLPSDFQHEDRQIILNESSIVRDGGKYHIFMRQDTEPFGLWRAKSTDLRNWSMPEPFCRNAHAPMTIKHDASIWLSFRRIIDDQNAAVSLTSPFDDDKLIDLDCYQGSPYDGGYSDPIIIDDRLYVFYYLGNPEGEPYIKVCRVDDLD